MTSQQAELTDARKSAFAAYKELAAKDSSLPGFCYYEFCQLFFSYLPGIVGFGLRGIFYPFMFASCGKALAVGRDVIIRNPAAIRLGNRNMLDDFCVLDARGSEAAVETGDYLVLGRSSALVAKGGRIHLADGVNIGTGCRIATQSKIEIGESTLIAAYSYIGPGNHQKEQNGQPLISQEMDVKGGVKIGSHVWIGARATILDGVNIGDRAVIGAHSLVRDDVPEGATAVGCPARIIGG